MYDNVFLFLSGKEDDLNAQLCLLVCVRTRLFFFFFLIIFFCFKQKLTSFSFFSFRKQDIIRHLHFWMNFAFKLVLLLVTQTTLNWSKFRNLTMLKYAFDVSVVNCKKKENLE